MTKQQFIKHCIKQLHLLVVNHDGDIELIDTSSDFQRYIKDSGITSWSTRYQETKFNVELARK